MEDGWILARALEYVYSHNSSHDAIQRALEIFEEIRAPYYDRTYTHLDESRAQMQRFQADNPNADFDIALRHKIDSFLYGDKDFIYKNDIHRVWEGYIARREKEQQQQSILDNARL
ncbi:hypothetical protein BDV19DRAFT_387899 [Aspergillus venezuelensis]